MNKKLFFEYIIPKVEPSLVNQGFTYQKSKGVFVKAIEDGWIKVSFSFYEFALANNFNSGFLLRKNKVQEILAKYVLQNAAELKASPTIIFSLTGLKKVRDNSFRDNSFRFENIAQLDDLLATEVIPFLENQVLKFSEKYTHIANVYKLLTDPSEEYNKQIWPNYSNYMTALIIGRIVFPDNFDVVKKTVNDLILGIKAKNPDSFEVVQYEENIDRAVQDLLDMP